MKQWDPSTDSLALREQGASRSQVEELPPDPAPLAPLADPEPEPPAAAEPAPEPAPEPVQAPQEGGPDAG
jgi:hypothetical protein